MDLRDLDLGFVELKGLGGKVAVPDLTFPGRSLDGPAFGERGDRKSVV